MPWTYFSKRFAMQMEGGYRYLDRCGQFMITAGADLQLIPVDDAKPTGAHLEEPESGINVKVDCNQILVTQEFGGDDAHFQEMCANVATLALELFAPNLIATITVKQQSYLALSSIEQAMEYILQLDPEHHNAIGKLIGMQPWQKKIEYHFKAGNYDSAISLVPTTFDSVTVRTYATPARASKWQKMRVARLNAGSDRIKVGARHVVMLDVSGIEHEPPTGFDDFKKAFHKVSTMRKTAEEAFTV